MRRAVVPFALIGLLAGAALAGDRPAVGRELVFARLQSPSFGVAGFYDAVRCGPYCTSYKPRVFLTGEGRLWREVTPRHVLTELEDVVFSSRLLGWIAANDCAAGKAFVYRTTDGGRTWRSAPVSATNCSAGSRLDLSFSDTKHGWILTVFENGNQARLERTRDGGKTWSELDTDAPLMGAIAFANARDGWLAKSDFASPLQLYATRDGGQSWRRRVLAAPRGWRGARLFPDAPKFFGNRGVLPVDLVRGKRAAVAFYVTGNGGRTWRLRAIRPVGFPVLASELFVKYVPTSIASPSVWWIASGRKRSSIAVTSNAGGSWRVSTPRMLPAAGPEISGIDARRAWFTTAVRNVALYATNDGGRTWRRLALPRARA
jgi:photosystem II stability/assembly factor-like uncharacterized protein